MEIVAASRLTQCDENEDEDEVPGGVQVSQHLLQHIHSVEVAIQVVQHTLQSFPLQRDTPVQHWLAVI